MVFFFYPQNLRHTTTEAEDIEQLDGEWPATVVQNGDVSESDDDYCVA